MEEYGIDKILMGMASQVAEKEDHIFTPDLLNYYYGPRHFSRRDEMALSIQVFVIFCSLERDIFPLCLPML